MLRTSRHKVGLIDALIAACAVGRNATLCTFNVKHYQIIPGLSLEQPGWSGLTRVHERRDALAFPPCAGYISQSRQYQQPLLLIPAR